MKLYQIWMQSNNPLRSYCHFSVWLYKLSHCVTCCARLWDNFHKVWPSTTYTCLNYSVFMLIRYVTLWPWPLTRWPESSWYTSSVTSYSRDRILYNLSEIEQSSAELLIILRIFARYLMLWPWPLTSWPCTFKAFQVSLPTKSERKRIIHGWVIDDLARFRVQF